jgi:peptidoglycan/xylan/chitin deacetylase (PgdA/CDA1 family)
MMSQRCWRDEQMNVCSRLLAPFGPDLASRRGMPSPSTAVRPAKLHAARLLLLLPVLAHAAPMPVEVHQVLAMEAAGEKIVALTLDACGGGYDGQLISFLTQKRLPTTVFVTKRWMARHPDGLAALRAHPELFDIEDHGERHVPAVLGPGRMVYGLHGNADVAQLKREVAAGADAIRIATGRAPIWYRAATGEYDPEALAVIAQMGYRVAGFSVNADDGAKLTRKQIVKRLSRVKHGDIIIAHMNRPDSDTAEGLAEGLQALLDRGFRFVTLRDAQVQYAADTARALARAAHP